MSDHSRWTDGRLETPSLVALRELLREGERVAPAVAGRAGLGHNELRALEHLVARPMAPSELAQELGVTTAASSGIIDRLQERGHARRVEHATDGRRRTVTISESGREEVLRHLTPMFAALSELDAGLTEAEREVVTRYLEGAAGALRSVL